MQDKKIGLYIAEAERGGQKETSKLLLYLINNAVSEVDLLKSIEVLNPAEENWRSSKKYFFARLKLRAKQEREGMVILEQLSEDGYLPAICRLATINFSNACSEPEKEDAIALLQQARKKGHVWAQRNYFLIRARESSTPIKQILQLRSILILVKILVIRRLYAPSDLTTY